MAKIHPTAVVEPTAEIDEDVTIEPYAVVKGSVKLKKGVVIKSHVYLDGATTIGEDSIVWPGASIGTKSQDRKYTGEITYVNIGRNCQIREFCTINSSCGGNSSVDIGDHCLVMAYCHVAHNCRVGNNVTLSNNVLLAGHVTVEDYVIIGGMTPVHQFVRIGCHSMVGGLSRVTHDIPPYTVGGGIPYKFGGINLVGLRRRGFMMQQRRPLAQVFRLVYRSGLTLDEALVRIESEVEQTEEVVHWLKFCQQSLRGLIGLEGVSRQLPDSEADLPDLFAEPLQQVR